MTSTTPSHLNRRRIVQGMGAAMLLPMGMARAADYPQRPIEVVVPASAGGSTDAVARAFADAIRKYLPQPLIVNNKPGASGVVGMTDVMNAKPDGYKISMAITELSILQHLGLSKFNYTAFKPVALLSADGATVTVRADSPWRTLEDFLAAAKAKPGQLNIGNSGNGSVWHLAAAALEESTKTKFGHVPFQGGAPAVLALLGGHVDAVTVSVGEVATHVQAGKLRILGVMADKRTRGYEQVPTLKERGIDLSVAGWRGLLAPKSTPDDVVATLRAATRKAVDDPAFQEQMDKLILTMLYLDAPEFEGMLSRTDEYFKNLVARSKITV